MIKQVFALTALSFAFFGCNMEQRNMTMAPDQGAVEQSENEPDRNITQAIRQSLMQDSALPLKAKNVVITTREGVVTLKGQVDSEVDKAKIENAAKSTSGVKSVNNQLVVIETAQKV